MKRTILSTGLALVVGCSTITTPCHEDFDCTIGEICEGASASATGSCAPAGPGSTRTFGAVDATFSSGSEAYLVSVAAVPAGPAAASAAEVPFQLSPAGSASRARLTSLVAQPVGPVALAPSRLAYERARYEATLRIVARQRLSGATASSTSAQVATCGDCGSAGMCWKGACTAHPQLRFLYAGPDLSCTLAGVVSAGGTDINVIVDDAAVGADGPALEAVQRLADTWPGELAWLGLDGHSGALDRDGDGRLSVVFTNATTSSVDLDIVGLFDPHDFLEASAPEATGNVADLLWSRVPGSTNTAGPVTIELVAGTLTHEYEHLASYAVRVQAKLPAGVPEVLWLDEALAHLMEDVNGWGGSNVAVVAAAFSHWNTASYAGSTDSVQQRGKGYLLLRYLLDRVALTPTATVGQLLSDTTTGLQHPLFGGTTSAKLSGWQLASFATGNPDVSYAAAHASDFAPMGESAITGTKTGITAFGDFTDARGDTVTLGGPEVLDVDLSAGTGALSDLSIAEAGSQLYVLTGGSGVVALRGTASAEVDLRLAIQRIR
jgi:hypothetical protein